MDAFATRAAPLIARGWAVIPLKPNGKTPLVKGRFAGYASTDPAQIARWSEQWPAANIGLVTGAASGVMVFDVDVKDGAGGLASLKERVERHGDLPMAPVVRTPTGGWHYYFEHVPGLRNKAGFAPGLDTRAEGGFVAAPGSFIDGKPYEWARPPEDAEMRKPPIWLQLATKVVQRKPRQRLCAPLSDHAGLEEVKEALSYINPDLPYGEWVAVVMAVHDAAGEAGWGIAEDWSSQGSKFKVNDIRARWGGFTQGGGVTMRTLFKRAREGGYRGPKEATR